MSTRAYCPDPDDSGITFNLRTGKLKTNHKPGLS